MQRKYHPDIAGEQSRELSSKINVAYDVLTNKQARRQYDSMYREHGFSTTSLNSVEGLTGPLRERAVPIDVRPCCGSSSAWFLSQRTLDPAAAT